MSETSQVPSKNTTKNPQNDDWHVLGVMSRSDQETFLISCGYNKEERDRIFDAARRFSQFTIVLQGKREYFDFRRPR